MKELDETQMYMLGKNFKIEWQCKNFKDGQLRLYKTTNSEVDVK